MDEFKRNYIVGEKIGDGNFAEVKVCECRKSGQKYAAKIIKMKQKTVFGHYDPNARGMTPPEVEREVQVLRSIDHHTIVKLHEVYEQNNYSVIILELVTGGELFARVAEFERLDEHEAACFVAQILQGVHHMHQLGIVHLDLKPENIMIENMEEKRIKIIDFGLARRLNPNEVIQDMAGTPEFCAPEVVNFDPITFATDMWSIGVMTYILLSGISPFAGDSQAETFQNILECSVTFDREEFIDVSQEARDFITRLLRKNPKKRHTASECLHHAWVKPVLKELSGQTQIIQKIDLNGVLPSMTRQPPSLSCSNHSTPKCDLMAQDKPHTTQRRLLSDESERRGGEDRRSSVAPPQVIQKIDLNGILPSLRSHSPSAVSSGTSSPKSSVKAQTKLAARTRKSIPKQTSDDKKWEDGEVEEDWERTLTREIPDRPQVIQKIDLNGVLPSLVPRLSSRNGSQSVQSSPKTQAKMHRVKRKSLETQHEETKHLTANSTSANESKPGSHKPTANHTNEVTYKHKVMLANTASKPICQSTRGVTRHPVAMEKGLVSRMSELQIATDKTSSKAFHVGSESLFERASKWLEATNSAFDRKFRPASANTTTTLSTSNSFHRARNAFINKNTLAERKMVFTRVKNGGDLEQAIPGFRWRVIPGTTTAAYERKANEAS